MSAMTATPTLASLSDIAALAGVQRPVPSMWRRRWAATEDPFPAPAARIGDRELFPLDAVVGWVERHGLGNSHTMREEAALFASLETEADARLVVDGLEALLALKAVSGATLGDLDRPALLDLADDADPLDAHLYREIEALSDTAPSWAARADAMVEAAFGVAPAIDTLTRQRRRLGLASPATFHPAATALCAAIAEELLAPDGRPAPVLVDPAGAGELLLAMQEPADGDAQVAQIPDARTPDARSLRRRLVASGWQLQSPSPDEGPDRLPGARALVAQLPSASCPDASDLDVVAAVEEIALALGQDDRAVVIGPAGALAARTRDTATREARAGALRTGKVRAIVRLRAGLWPSRSRQPLAVWVLGAPPDGAPIRDTAVAVADLAATPLSPAVQQDVVTDVLAAMGGVASARAHAFRFARLVPTPSLVATDGDLVTVVPPVVRPRRSPVELALEAQRLAATVRAPAPGVSIDLVHNEHGGARTATVGQLLANGALRLVSANRIDPGDVTPGAAVPVIGPDELLGARRRGERGVDRLAFAARYPAGRYTEPGDVVFCTAPATTAIVDTEGFSVVVHPAHVLRVDPGRARGLTPELLAHALRNGPGVGPWRSWPVRLVPPGQEGPLEAALRDAERARADARARLDALDALASTLVEGVSTGALVLNPPTERDDAHPGQEG